jgi:hypothetical protein
MFRQYFNVICAFLVLISLFSCKSTKQVADTKQNSDIVVSDGKSLLWKITSPQQETPSYLF